MLLGCVGGVFEVGMYNRLVLEGNVCRLHDKTRS